MTYDPPHRALVTECPRCRDVRGQHLDGCPVGEAEHRAEAAEALVEHAYHTGWRTGCARSRSIATSGEAARKRASDWREFVATVNAERNTNSEGRP